MSILELIRENFVVGIDIVQPGRYAYAVVINNMVVERGECTEDELLKVLKKYRPLILAIDNLREILDLGKKFLKRLSKLPFTVHIVQVTRVKPDLEISVEELVREYLGVPITKLSPEQTAEYLALLVCKGVGSIVRLYEPETRIIVKATLGTKEGGMSRNRYERNVYLRIKQLVEEISNKLSKEGLDFDLFFRDSEGTKSAIFVVYADKNIVRKVVKPVKSMDVKVVIEQVLTDNIKFISLTGEEKIETPISGRYVIVGVDPGIVTGLAILDLNGNVLALYSGKNVSRRKVLDLVYEHGTPLIIATDVARPPDYVKKLCAMTHAVLYTPERDLSVSEKCELASKIAFEQKIQVKDPHQRDALAAAYKAYMSYKPKFDKVVEEVRKLNLPIPIDEVKALVVRGLSVKQAIDQVIARYRRDKSTRVIIIKQQDETTARRVQELEQRVKLLEGEVKKLVEEKRKLEERVQQLEEETYIEIRRDLTIRGLEARIRQLQYEIESLRQREDGLRKSLETIRKVVEEYFLTGDYKPVLNVDAVFKHGLCVDIVYTRSQLSDFMYEKLAREHCVKVIIQEGQISEKLQRKLWDRYSLVLVDLDRLKDGLFKVSDNVMLVRKDLLESTVENVKESIRKYLTEKDLLKLIEDYRKFRIA